MPPIGETLRDARVRRQIEISEVEQATKIRSKYLRALEAEEFDRLPGSTFVRQFLRTYAEYLGLDSQLLVEEYRSRHESPDAEDVQQFTPPPPPASGGREGRRRPQGPGRGTVIVGALVALLAVIIVVGLVAGDEQGDGDRARDTAEPRRGQGSQGQGQGRGGGRGRGGDGSGGGGDRVRLTVTPAAETYVCVENGAGEQLFESTISEQESFSGQVLRVNLGNTQVELEVDGEQFPVEESANPVGFEFTPDGGEELPEGERPCA